MSLEGTIPNVLKPILPYLQRANDFEKRAPLVAFYCRTYAAQVGIQLIRQVQDKEATNYIFQLMNQLEQDKNQLNPNTEEGRATVEVFALKMFKKADDHDRAGQHTAVVAKLFYASSILMEVTKQFGELSEDLMEKQKYARWKAAEISRAIKTGNPIQPGSYFEQQQSTEEDSDGDALMEQQQQQSQQQQLTRQTTPQTPQSTGASQATPDFNNYFSSNYTGEDTRVDNYSNYHQSPQQQQTTPDFGSYFNTNTNASSTYVQQYDHGASHNDQHEEEEDDFEKRLKRFQMENNIDEEEEEHHDDNQSTQLPPPSFESYFNNTQQQQNQFASIPPPPKSDSFNALLQQFNQPSQSQNNQSQQSKQQQQNNRQSSDQYSGYSNIPPPQQQQTRPQTPQQTQPPVQQQKFQQQPPQQQHYTQPSRSIPQQQQQAIVQTPPAANTIVLQSKEPTLDEKMKAQKFCKFAMSSLQFDDVISARKYLKDALELLGSE